MTVQLLANLYHEIETMNDFLNNNKTKEKKYLAIDQHHLIITSNQNAQVTEKEIVEHIQLIKEKLATLETSDQRIKMENRLNEVAKKLLQTSNFNFQSDFDEDFNIMNETVPIENNNIFFGTDILVFKQSYQGTMPTNGIKENDFKQISLLLDKLKKNGKIKKLIINTSDLDNIKEKEFFKKEIIEMITMLCTRNAGREIVLQLIQAKKRIEISPYKIKTCLFIAPAPNTQHRARILINNEINFYLPTYKGLSNELHRKNNTLEYTPTFIILGHEMCHAVHWIKNQNLFFKNVRYTLPKIGNTEEQHTILGWDTNDYDALHYTCPIEEDNVFFGSDILVINESHQGRIPINGIRESEFNEISSTLTRLKTDGGIGNLTINSSGLENIKQEELFKNEIVDMITKLCTRKSGREILSKLIQSENKTEISPCIQIDCFFVPSINDASNSDKILINPFNPMIIKNLPNYKSLFDNLDPKNNNIEYSIDFITLGGEMHKAIRYYGDKNGKDDILTPEDLSVDSWNPDVYNSSGEMIEPYFLWDKLSENGLRSLFGVSPRTEDYSKVEEILRVDDLRRQIKAQLLYQNAKPSQLFTPDSVELIDLRFGWDKFLSELLNDAYEQKKWSLVIELKTLGAKPVSQEKWDRCLERDAILNFIDPQKYNPGCPFISLGADPILISALPHMSTEKLVDKLKDHVIADILSRQRTILEDHEIKKFVESVKNWDRFTYEIIDQLYALKEWKKISFIYTSTSSLRLHANEITSKWATTLNEEFIRLAKAGNHEYLKLISLGAQPTQEDLSSLFSNKHQLDEIAEKRENFQKLGDLNEKLWFA